MVYFVEEVSDGRSSDSIARGRIGGGGYVGTSPDVPGLVAEGRSMGELMEIARDVARKIAESCIEHGDPLPPALGVGSQRTLELTIPVSVG
jgi:predicted RNase H-like HicB family nuclease